MPHYFAFAVQGVDQGKVPYRDFKIEYPPVSYWVVALTRVLEQPTEPPSDPQLHYPASYRLRFMGMMCAFDVASFVLFSLALSRRRPSSLVRGAWGYAILGVLLAPVLYDRLDMPLLFLLMTWAVAVTGCLQAPEPPRVALMIASLALGLSVALKWFPLLCLPFFWFGVRRTTQCTQLLVGGLLGASAVLPFLLHWFSAGSAVFWFLEFHAQRTLEVESLYSSLLLSAVPFGYNILAFQGRGSWDVAGPSAQLLARVSAVVMLLIPIILAVWAWIRRSDYDLRAGYRFCLLILIACVVGAKVLSPQYFVWLLPLLLLLGVEILDEHRLMVLLGALLVIAAVTTWIFPFHFFQIRHPQTGAIYGSSALLQGFGPVRFFHPGTALLLVMRNLLLMTVVSWLAVKLAQRAFLDPPIDDR